MRMISRRQQLQARSSLGVDEEANLSPWTRKVLSSSSSWQTFKAQNQTETWLNWETRPRFCANNYKANFWLEVFFALLRLWTLCPFPSTICFNRHLCSRPDFNILRSCQDRSDKSCWMSRHVRLEHYSKVMQLAVSSAKAPHNFPCDRAWAGEMGKYLHYELSSADTHHRRRLCMSGGTISRASTCEGLRRAESLAVILGGSLSCLRRTRC